MNRHKVSLSVLLLLTPNAAIAHTPTKGMNNFYNGMLHPILEPAHLALLIATGLLYGQRAKHQDKLPVDIYLLAILVGLVIAWFSLDFPLNTIILACASLVGLTVAFGRNLPGYWYVFILGLSGLIVASDSSPGTLNGLDKLIALSGSGVAMVILLFNTMTLAEYFNKSQWQRIGIQVLGSWIAASSLLVLSLLFNA